MLSRNRSFALAAVLALAATATVAQEVCPCVPLSHTWIAEPCETWNCAASAMVMANGDANVLVMPTASEKFKWVVVRRVVSGSVAVSPDAPFLVENFGTMTDGSARFAAIENAHVPLLVTTADGNTLVVYLRQAEERPRAVKH